MASSQGRGKKLLDRALDALRSAGFDAANGGRYVSWMRQYILFRDKRHPQEMGTMEVEQFLTHSAVERQVSPSTQKQALCALVFLHETVLGMELVESGGIRGQIYFFFS